MLTISPWLGMAGVLLALGGAVSLLRMMQVRYAPHPELVRKLLHVTMGLVTLSFPWVFNAAWPVVTLAVGTTGLMVLVRYRTALRTNVGSVIHAIERQSYGEVCFPLAVALVFVLSGGDPVLYGIPILLLALADPAAALVGVWYGRLRYRTADGTKSGEGSLAFLIVAFLCTYLPLLLFADIEPIESLLLAGLAGLLAMMIEASSWRGLDNLFVPIGGFVLIHTHLPLEVSTLALRLAVLAFLFTAAWMYRRRTTLDGSALMAAALVGFMTWVGGGWAWLLAPAVLYAGYTRLWPGPADVRRHTVHHVLSVASVGMGWLVLAMVLDQPALLFPYTLAYTAALTLIGVERLLAHARLRSSLAVWSSSAFKSSVVVLLPYLLTNGQASQVFAYATCTLAAAGLAALVFSRYAWFFHLHPYETSARLYRAALIAAASALGLLAPGVL